MLIANHASAPKTPYPEPLTISDVQVQLDRLSGAIEQLQTAAANLIGRLDPVLIPNSKADSGPCAVESCAATNIGESINIAARLVRTVSASLLDATSRLGV